MQVSHSRQSSLHSDPPSVEDTTSTHSASQTISVKSQTTSQAASQTSIVVDLESLSSKPAKCPKLHWYAFKGDLGGVLACINAGDDLERPITMMNANNEPVQGVTALYIAAQKGYLEMCKLLVQNGADCDAECRIGRSREYCSAAQIAQIHGHYRTWWYLSRRQEKRLGLAKLIPRRTT